MSTLHLVVATALIAALAPACDSLSSAECESDSDCSGDDVCDDDECVECANDSDCDDDEECDDGDCENVGEGEGEEGEGEGGEGEGEGGEGEGEGGEGEGECDVSAFDNPAGEGLFASDATLDIDDFENIAGCTFADEAFLIIFEIDDTSITDVEVDDTVWSEAGDSLQFCAGFLSISEGFVVCPVCFSEVPSDLAVQFDNGFDVSNAICVDTSGA